jgi:ech hydrogenase subunit B
MGADRKLTAAIQLRAGPPLAQPLYDLTKLLAKTSPPPDRLVAALLAAHVVLAAGSLALILAGGDLLAAVLVLGAAQVLFVLAAASIESPYAQLGASRELVLLVAVEPLLVLVVIAFALVAGSFSTGAILEGPGVPALSVPTVGVTVAVLLAATLRKSPFDLATSHHAHQELVKGSTTEMAGRWLALAELGHWYEAALILALIAIAAAGRPLLAVALVALTYGAVIVADNALPRATWRSALLVAWGVGGSAAVVALIATQLAGGGVLP